MQKNACIIYEKYGNFRNILSCFLSLSDTKYFFKRACQGWPNRIFMIFLRCRVIGLIIAVGLHYHLKMKSYRILYFLILTLALNGCGKAPLISNDQAIFFQYDYVNYSWGYQHNGFIIDFDGNVLVYENPEKWNFPDTDFILTSEQVSENISACKISGIKIKKEDLQKFTGYINNIASSKVTALKNVAEDAGSGEYICYQYSVNHSSYKGSLIRMEGDFTCENLNFYSKKVADWMKEINNNILLKQD